MASIGPSHQRAGLGPWILPGGLGSWRGRRGLAGHAEPAGDSSRTTDLGSCSRCPTSTPRYGDEDRPAFWAGVFPVFPSLYATRWACQHPQGQRRGGLGRAQPLAVPRHRPVASDARTSAALAGVPPGYRPAEVNGGKGPARAVGAGAGAVSRVSLRFCRVRNHPPSMIRVPRPGATVSMAASSGRIQGSFPRERDRSTNGIRRI